MTDFKAPPPPPGNFAPSEPETQSMVQNQSAQQAMPPVNDEAGNTETAPVPTNRFATQKEKIMQKFKELPDNKRQVVVAVGIFVIGLLMGAIMFGGSSEPAPQAPKGLQGIVANPDIRPEQNLKRCGMVEASSPCVLYVMNNYTYEKMAEDFFEAAVSVTGRKVRVIRMDNVRYATMRIPPGYFAQIKIPAYK